MYHQPHPLRHGPHIIHKTHPCNQRQPQHKPRKTKPTSNKINQGPHVKHNPSSPQRDSCVRTPLVRLINNIKMICHPEIEQLHPQ